jgi:hypothetical protein
MAASIAYRWDMDLSPGRRTLPETFLPGWMITLDALVISANYLYQTFRFLALVVDSRLGLGRIN